MGAAATAEVISTVLLQLLTNAQTLAAKQAAGNVTEQDITDALTLESTTHDQLVAAIAAAP